MRSVWTRCAGAALVLLLAGCGGRAAAPSPAPTQTTRAVAPPHVRLSASDQRFARSLIADDDEDLAGDPLGVRKSAAPALQTLAAKRAREQTAEVKSAVNALARAQAPTAPLLTAAGRRSWDSDYTTLVDNAGYRFDDAYVSTTESRDQAELTLARAEERLGLSAPLKALARRVARARTAEVEQLRTISA